MSGFTVTMNVLSSRETDVLVCVHTVGRLQKLVRNQVPICSVLFQFTRMPPSNWLFFIHINIQMTDLSLSDLVLFLASTYLVIVFSHCFRYFTFLYNMLLSILHFTNVRFFICFWWFIVKGEDLIQALDVFKKFFF